MMKAMLTAIVITSACAMTACAPATTKSGSTTDLALMQGRVAASEEKMEQLSQQVALLQMMVDSHQRTLQNLENQDVKDTGAGKIDAQPLPAVSETQIVPATPLVQSAPPAVEVVEETLTPEDTPGITEETRPAPPAIEQELQPESTTRIPAEVAAPADDEPNPQYQEVMEIFRSGDYEAAGPLFEAFAEEFPEDELADNALYWAGECKYTKKKFTEAINRFKRVVEEYPDGSKVPDAMLKIGFAYISLGDTESAVAYLKKVVAQYPFSSAGAKAEERLKTINR